MKTILGVAKGIIVLKQFETVKNQPKRKSNMEEKKELITMKQAAEIMGVSYLTIWNWVHKGKFQKVIRYSKSMIRLEKEEVIRFANNGI